MRLSSCAACLVGVLFSLTVPPPVTHASEKTDQAPLLVRQLGSSSFAEREVAHKELLRLGSVAVPALREGLKSNDLEVKRRCKELIPAIEQAEWAQKADAYETDSMGEHKQALPLHKEFEKLIGADPTARKLFAEILRTNGGFVQRMADATDNRRRIYEIRCRELFPSLKVKKELDATVEQVGKVCPGDLAALMLVASVFKVDQTLSWKERNHVADLLGNAGIGEAVRDENTGKALSRLLVAWAQNQRLSDSISLSYFLHFVHRENFNEGFVVLRKVIQAKEGHDGPMPDSRAVAVAVLAKVGGTEVADELEKLQGDQRILFHSPDDRPVEIRLGDEALAASMLLEGANPKDYGMACFTICVTTPPGMDLWLVPLYGFVSDSDRRKARKQWHLSQKRERRKGKRGKEGHSLRQAREKRDIQDSIEKRGEEGKEGGGKREKKGGRDS